MGTSLQATRIALYKPLFDSVFDVMQPSTPVEHCEVVQTVEKWIYTTHSSDYPELGSEGFHNAVKSIVGDIEDDREINAYLNAGGGTTEFVTKRGSKIQVIKVC